MKFDESKIIDSAKNCIDDVMQSINDPDLDGWDKFYLGKVYAYLDVLGGCTDYKTAMSKRKYITQEEFDAAHKIASEKFVDKPPRLNRSAWEPCAYCGDYYGKCCANCWNGGKQAYQEPCKSCYCASKWKPKENFCPCCGRPMHDAAWEMLQKRLEGHK